MAMTSKPSGDDRKGATLGGPRAVGELAGRILNKPLSKRGLAAATLAADWASIVGPALAESTLPLKVSFPRGERNQGTLHLKVASGAMALQLQHLGPLILERVNGHFGYRAVTQLTLVQGPVPNRAAARPATKKLSTATVDAELASQIEALPDSDLRAALDGLGRQLAPTWQRS